MGVGVLRLRLLLADADMLQLVLERLHDRVQIDGDRGKTKKWTRHHAFDQLAAAHVASVPKNV